MRFPRVPGPRSLAAQLFAMQAVLIAVVVAGCALFTYLSDRSQAEDAAGRQAMAVARSVADAPSVREAILTAPTRRRCSSRTPSQVQHHTDVDFVTIMNPRGHPLDPPRRGADRAALPRAPGARAARRVRSRRPTPAPSARPSAWSTPIRADDGDGAIVGPGQRGHPVEEISAQVQRPGHGAVRGRRGRAGAGRDRHVRHQRPAAPPHARDERGRAEPYARLPPGRAARRARGAADARRAAPGRADQRRRA